MAAAATDYFTEVGSPGTATTLAAPGHIIAGTAITVVATTNWPTATGVIFAMDTVTIVDGEEVRDVGTYTEWEGVVASATSITGLVLRVGSDQNYPAGSTTRVYIPVAATHENRLVDGILVDHKQDGHHKLSANYDPSNLTLETQKWAGVASAVNELTATNAAAGNAPELSATGDDSNIDVKITPKGTGNVAITKRFDNWITGLTAPTVTASGNRNYSLSVAATDYTDRLSAGMRLKLTRTVAAPTQATNLNGTTQYYSKTTPNKLTFTDDFVVSAWVKPTSYPASDSLIASRYNGTSGWGLYFTTAGAVALAGYNAGAANFSQVKSFQALPLNKWSHVTLQLDMSAFTATTTTSYFMLDGLDAPAFVQRGGTNPTALIQAGDLQIGAGNGAAAFFPGKIAQVAIYNAKVTQANVLLTISQGLAGTETSLASGYSFNNSIADLNTTTPNDLTAAGSAVATNADSPFGLQASGLISSTVEYAKIISVTFSTNTTVTVEVASGSAIPSSGGITAMAYSTADNPYGCPRITGARNCSTNVTSTTASTTFTDCADGAACAVTVNVGPSGQAIVSWGALMGNSGADGVCQSSFGVTGATTITGVVVGGAGMGHVIVSRLTTATATMVLGRSVMLQDLTPGSTTFTIKFAVGAGTGTFGSRVINVAPL